MKVKTASIFLLILICYLSIPKVDQFEIKPKDPISQVENFVNIYTNKEEYSIFDLIFVTFEYYSDSLSQYFYAILDNYGKLQSILCQSNVFQGIDDDINELYIFNLSDCGIQVPNKGKYYYISLIENLIVVESKEIFIQKENLNCVLSNNYTIIEFPKTYTFTFTLSSIENHSHYYQEEKIKCLITSDNNLFYEIDATKTSNIGEYSVIYNSRDYTLRENISLIIIIQDNYYFEDINFTINLRVINTHKDLILSLITIGIALPLILLILHQKKKNQIYEISDIKLL